MVTDEAEVNEVKWGLAELGGDVDDLSITAMLLLTVVRGGSWGNVDLRLVWIWGACWSSDILYLYNYSFLKKKTFPVLWILCFGFL